MAEQDGSIPYHFTREGIPDVAVLIVNYKTADYLGRCLETVLDDTQSEIQCAVFVGDNHSGDDLTSLEEDYGSSVEFHRFEKNLGYGGANNRLADISARTKSPAILILNPDTIFTEKHTVRRLFDRLSSHSQVKVVGPKLVRPVTSERQLWDHADFPLNLKLSPYRFQPYLIPVAPWFKDDKPTEVPWVSGAVSLMDREIFTETGGYDPNIFLYFEETDLCQRIRNRGGVVVYDPTIIVEHVGSVSTRNMKQEYFLDSFRYLVRKHHSPWVAAAMEAVYRRLPFDQ